MSLTNLNLCDDFKLVSHKKKRTKAEKEIKLQPFIEPIGSHIFDLDSAIRRIEAAKEEILSSDVYSSIVASLREGLNILQTTTIKEIVCFGLGKVSECVIARYQLALVLCLRDRYLVKVLAYDPIFNEDDHSILKKLDFDLLYTNCEGKYQVEENPTLFYLPHCSKQLTNNLLWSNWGLQLNKCVIISNSFTDILESNSAQQIARNAEYILKTSPYVTELAVINSFKYYDIFNNTAIHIFPLESIGLISRDFWDNCSEPQYSKYDLEFITSKFENELRL